jgi:NhaP-type Na+/H+ or K+/H+ antiporter
LSPAALALGAADAATTAAALSARLVPAGLSESTRRTLEGESGLDTARVAGLILGSPEFQRR